MREFRDDQGRPWQLALTVTAVMRVRDQVLIEVDGAKKPFKIDDVASLEATLRILETQPTVLAEAVYAILCKQVEEKGLTKDQFFDGLRGDVLDAAMRVLVEELVDFFPQRHRPLASLTAEAHEKLMGSVFAGAVAQLQEALSQKTLTPSGMPFGRQPESSESTQESGHSDNSSQPVMAA